MILIEQTMHPLTSSWSWLCCFALLLMFGCGQSTPATAQPEQETIPAPPVFQVPPPVDGFGFPVGPPDTKGYYNAQVFGKNAHLGDDWNGVGGGNTDLGDPVYSIGIGRVVLAKDLQGGWGNVVRVLHNIGTAEAPEYIESLYAHLDTILIDSNALLTRGQQLGTIGNAHGIYYAHLHLEIRDSIDMPIGGGYGEEDAGYLDPTKFIKEWK